MSDPVEEQTPSVYAKLLEEADKVVAIIRDDPQFDGSGQWDRVFPWYEFADLDDAITAVREQGHPDKTPADYAELHQLFVSRGEWCGVLLHQRDRLRTALAHAVRGLYRTHDPFGPQYKAALAVTADVHNDPHSPESLAREEQLYATPAQ